MGTHITIIPDCPKCGNELRRAMHYKQGTQTEENPYGEAVREWVCNCGYRRPYKYEDLEVKKG